MTRVLFTGDREFGDLAAVRTMFVALIEQYGDFTVVHGACSRKRAGVEVSADMLVDQVARELRHRVEPHPAEWNRFRNGAGPIRNRAMLATLDPGDPVVAFHNDIESSRGTRGMLLLALHAGHEAVLVSSLRARRVYLDEVGVLTVADEGDRL